MSFEEEFDKIIRQKADEASFPFDEKNWENASAMIESDRKAARILKLKRVLKPALALTALATAVIITFTYVDHKKPQANLLVEGKTENKSIQTIIHSNKVNSEKQSNTPAVTQAKSEASVISATKEKSTVDLSAKKETMVPTAKTTVAELTPVTESNIQKNSSTPLSSEKNTANNNTSVNGGDIIAAAGAIAAQEAMPASSQIPAKDDSAVPEAIASQQNPAVAAESQTAEEQTRIDHLTGFLLNLPNDLSEKSLVAENLLTIIKYDDAYFKAKRKTHYLNVEGGISYLNGWSNSADNDAKGYNYFGGINYGFYLSNKISLGIGVQAYNVAHMNDPFYSASHKDYDFGSTTVYTVVTCGQLYYAAIPLNINYAINKTNSFGLGFNAAYLFNSDITTESYYYQDNAKIQTSKTSEKAIYEGTSQYNYMLTAQFSHKFGKRIALKAEGMYGLTDIFANTSEIKNTEKTQGIRLSLIYTIFDK